MSDTRHCWELLNEHIALFAAVEVSRFGLSVTPTDRLGMARLLKRLNPVSQSKTLPLSHRTGSKSHDLASKSQGDTHGQKHSNYRIEW